MQFALKLLALLTTLGPLAWAMLGTPAERAHRTEIWLYCQLLTIGFVITAWLLRRRELASWPQATGTVVSAKQTGMFGAGVLAMLVEVEHGTGGLSNRITTKIRVPIAELSRYGVGRTVTVAINPRNSRDGVVVI